MAWWIRPSQLKAQGIMGMNCRNIDFISQYNDRCLYPLVDNKLKTKLLAEESEVKSPSLHGVIRQQHEVKKIMGFLTGLDGFAIKPARGSGGKGILVIVGREGEDFLRASGKKMSLEDIQRHVTNILAGLYSLAGAPDTALIEGLIRADDLFANYSFQGVPDIRIIVFKGYPVMAMLRLSTHQSDGKANLHQGAIGVGLDMCSGQAVHAVQFERRLTHHPDTGAELNQIQIPDWPDLLKLASRCYEMTGLGYLGADIVLDADRGPMLLELNARPGLTIQVANGTGLLPRLRHIETLDQPKATPEQRVDYVQEYFRAKLLI
ncbi:MAG: alpha-L-glutamate ligase-like protein [Thiomicrospira sp.]|uniref:alpha-L-glutamate ligase-like protein n=1 Tax=Thiomicrospira sp. TaxID=935 RepID=UPI0019E175C5|nr:alpha-L-glutamate ligase-like protein [Thiomicrospira sp.]MBE0494200.1 alpha-L-glutamate ligase-like protein [Thiomicrospira sp.]